MKLNLALNHNVIKYLENYTTGFFSTLQVFYAIKANAIKHTKIDDLDKQLDIETLCVEYKRPKDITVLAGRKTTNKQTNKQTKNR